MVYYSHLIGAMSTAVAISGHYNDLFKVWNFCNWVKGTNKLLSFNYDLQLLRPVHTKNDKHVLQFCRMPL